MWILILICRCKFTYYVWFCIGWNNRSIMLTKDEVCRLLALWDKWYFPLCFFVDASIQFNFHVRNKRITAFVGILTRNERDCGKRARLDPLEQNRLYHNMLTVNHFYHFLDKIFSKQLRILLAFNSNHKSINYFLS